MDKFRELEERIQEAIKHLDEQIAKKQDENEYLSAKIDSTDNYIRNLKVSLRSVDEKRYILENIENKNIILYVLRECLKEIAQAYQNYIKSKKWLGIIGFPILFALCIATLTLFTLDMGFQGFLIISTIISIILVGGNAENLEKLYNIKKSYTLAELSDARESIVKSIDTHSKNITDYKTKSAGITIELKDLMSEKEQFVFDLERVRTVRTQIIAETIPNILDNAYLTFNDSEIKARLRAKEKKEGEE